METDVYEKQIAHLGFIESIITRMATNSFLLKGWSITLLAAIFALSVKDANSQFLLIAYLPIILFWVLDGYFYQQECLYRDLYKKVAADEQLSEAFTLDPRSQGVQSKSVLCCAADKTVWPIYALLVILVVLAKAFKQV